MLQEQVGGGWGGGRQGPLVLTAAVDVDTGSSGPTHILLPSGNPPGYNYTLTCVLAIFNITTRL